MGRRLADRNKLAWLSIEGSTFRSHLGRRVEHLLRLSRHSPPRTGSCPHTLTKITLVIVLVFTTFLTSAWIRSQAVPNRGESNVNVLKLSWRRSLAAAVVVPFLVSLSQDTKSADPAQDTSPAPAAAQVSPQEPGEGERPARQRVQRALRELEEQAAALESQLRELGDKHPDKAEELKRELNGVHEQMRGLRERDGAQVPGNIEGAMRELQERISATERQLQEAGGEQTDKGVAIHRELNGMRERMQRLRRRAAASEQPPAQGAIRELRQRAAAIEGELRDLGDGNPDKAEALKQELNGIRARMQASRQPASASEDRVPQGAIRELRERAAALEQELRELGDDHPDRAQAIKEELKALREKAQRLHSEGGRVAPQPDNVPQGHAAESSATSREIAELRGQVREMRQEMEALRAEVRRLLERDARDRN
jgi:chromosome segregation ATPase